MNVAETVTTIVSLLGGPKINAEDIEWAADIPAGQRLLEWLAAQVSTGEVDDDGSDASYKVRAALTGVALEGEELQMLRRATGKHAGTNSDASAPTEFGPQVPPEYIPPWRLRAEEQCMGTEAALLEAETEVLKARLSQSKLAAQSLAQAIKSIAAEIERTDSGVLATQEKLSELSIKADAAVSSSVNSSMRLLDALNDSAPDASPHAMSLAAAASLRTAITDRFHTQMRAIDAAAARLPTPADVQAECRRLSATLSLAPRAADVAFEAEVARLCDPAALADFLASATDEPQQPAREAVAVDVKAELECAWACDQAALLDARGTALDEAIAAFEGSLLPPLTALHGELATTSVHVHTAEALLGALREEMADIVADVRTARYVHENAAPPRPAADAKDEELQTGLVELLKRTKDFRPPDAPPLVLLSREDILAELRAVYAWADTARRQEDAWTADLLPALRNAEAAHAPLLGAAYTNSPMNTSPPFAFPGTVREVQANARARAEELGEVIAGLQEEVQTLESDRTKRRLQHFVEKWTRNQ